MKKYFSPYWLYCNGSPVARLYDLSNALIEFVLFCKRNLDSVVELWHGCKLVDASYHYHDWKMFDFYNSHKILWPCVN